MKQPIRVKIYGILPLTKQTYVIMQLVVFFGIAPLLFALCIINYVFSGQQVLWLGIGVLTAVAVVAEGIETVIVLRKLKAEGTTASDQRLGSVQ